MSISALVMAIALNVMNFQDALLVFVIAAPFIATGISLIFARLGFDSLFSRKTQSATMGHDFITIVAKPAKLSVQIDLSS